MTYTHIHSEKEEYRKEEEDDDEEEETFVKFWCRQYMLFDLYNSLICSNFLYKIVAV